MKQTFTYLVAAVLGFLSPSLSSQAQNFNGVFKEVTSQADFTEGYYVMVNPTTDEALIGSMQSTEANKKRGKTVILTSDLFRTKHEILNPLNAAVWKVEHDSQGFTVKHTTSNEYFVNPQSHNALILGEYSQRIYFDIAKKKISADKGNGFTLKHKKFELCINKNIKESFVFTAKDISGLHTPRFFKFVGFPFTMSAVQYATYYGDKTVKLPAGLTANVGEIDAQKHMLKLTPIGNVVPANTAVIITGAAGEYTLDVTTETAQVSTKNDLKGSMTEIPATTVSSASVAYYAMGYNTDAQKVSFGLVEGTSIPAGKAYIEISKTAGAAPELLGDFLISSVQHVQRDTDSATIYDLNGRKVTQPVSGQLYVRNGKKFIYLR